MPLHADAEAVGRRLDALDDAVGRGGVHHDAGRRIGRRLMVRTVHLQLVGAHDACSCVPWRTFTVWPGSLADWVYVRQRSETVRECEDHCASTKAGAAGRRRCETGLFWFERALVTGTRRRWAVLGDKVARARSPHSRTDRTSNAPPGTTGHRCAEIGAERGRAHARGDRQAAAESWVEIVLARHTENWNSPRAFLHPG